MENNKVVIKRDGYIANYDRRKIENAIYPAFISNNIPITERVKFDINCIIDSIEEILDRPIGIEIIQNMIIDSLREYGYYKVSQKYESYRISKNELREDRNEIYQKVFEVIDLKDKDTLKENSNKDTKNVAVQRDVIAGITVKNFYLKYFVRPDVRIAYEENLLHLHDLDNALNKGNCCIFDYETVMKGGFNLGATRIREPQSIKSGFSVLAEIIINGSGLNK